MIEVVKPNFQNEPQYLTPEAREDAREIRTKVWAESISILNGKNFKVLIPSNSCYWHITVRVKKWFENDLKGKVARTA